MTGPSQAGNELVIGIRSASARDRDLSRLLRTLAERWDPQEPWTQEMRRRQAWLPDASKNERRWLEGESNLRMGEGALHDMAN